MRKVLVTGGAGYIGCLAVEELIKRGHKPIVFETFLWGKESLECDCRNEHFRDNESGTQNGRTG